MRLAGSRASGWLLIAVLLLLWEASARFWVDSQSWPPVSQVLATFAREVWAGRLGIVVLSSLATALAGFLSGAVVAIALGLVLGTVPVLYRFINPLVEFVRPVPTPAVVPPLILLLGVGDAMKICIVALSTFFPVFVNTVNGVRSTGDVLLQTAATFRTGAVATVLKVVLPASWPAIVAGLRTSMALALIVTVIAEMIAGSSGIGFYLIESQFALKPDAMYAGVLALMLLGYGLNRTILLAEAFLLRNRRAQ